MLVENAWRWERVNYPRFCDNHEMRSERQMDFRISLEKNTLPVKYVVIQPNYMNSYFWIIEASGYVCFVVWRRSPIRELDNIRNAVRIHFVLSESNTVTDITYYAPFWVIPRLFASF